MPPIGVQASAHVPLLQMVQVPQQVPSLMARTSLQAPAAAYRRYAGASVSRALDADADAWVGADGRLCHPHTVMPLHAVCGAADMSLEPEIDRQGSAASHHRSSRLDRSPPPRRGALRCSACRSGQTLDTVPVQLSGRSHSPVAARRTTVAARAKGDLSGTPPWRHHRPRRHRRRSPDRSR